MKKVFIVLLLLVSVFLIGNAKVASADDGNCDGYQCTGKFACEGDFDEDIINEVNEVIREECFTLCSDKGNAYLYSYWGACDLGGRSLFASSKNFVGTGYTYGYEVSLGCAVDLRGNSMTVDLFTVDLSEDGCMMQLRCVKSESCLIE